MKILYTVEYDFYTELLDWSNVSNLRNALVDDAWECFKSDADPKEFAVWNELAGETVFTDIELDGPTVRVTISEDEKTDYWLSWVKNASHEDMCEMYRFAPAGHPCFGGDEVATSAFFEKWNELGGFTVELSKKVGWVKK